jgi:hypothetical protein
LPQLLRPSRFCFPSLLPTGCAPGYFTQPDAMNICEACPKNSWCPGGVGAAAAKNLCGSCLMTGTPLAQNTSACITQPGCGYRPDGSGSVCSIGTYSSGNNQQPCTPCPAGLTTVAARAESIAACSAPAGYFFQVCPTCTAVPVCVHVAMCFVLNLVHAWHALTWQQAYCQCRTCALALCKWPGDQLCC